MEQIAKLKFVKIEKIILSLNESIDIISRNTDSTHEKGLRDSVIQRFEYSIEGIWKFLKYFLLEEYGEDESSPKMIIKTSFKNGILPDMKIFIDMIEKRNRLSHDYHEEFAETSFENIIDYYIDPINSFLEYIRKHYE